MKMNYFQQQLNKELGTRLMLARNKNELSQEGLQIKISIFCYEYYETYLKGKGFSNEEIESFLNTKFNELNPSLQEKLQSLGISKSPANVAISTISNYENGKELIPAWFIEISKKILGNF